MSWALVGVMVLTGLFLSGFFSGAETGLYRVNRLRLHLAVQRGDPRARRLAGVIGHEQRALSVTLIGTNLANFATTLAVTYALADRLGFSEAKAELYTVVALTPVVFVFGEMVPKTLFQLHADRLLVSGSRLLAGAGALFRMTGLVWLLTSLAAGIHRITGRHRGLRGAVDPKRRVAMLLQEALARDAVRREQSALIDRVCQISETPLHAVMVPRNRVTVIAAGAGRRELLRLARRTGHARLPVYDTNPRHIIGVAKIDALLQSDDWHRVGERLVPSPSLSPHDTVASAITRLQQAGRRLAVVTDRGGQMLGIVTLKDLLREVVGDVAAGV